jgi:hypothetical protein
MATEKAAALLTEEATLILNSTRVKFAAKVIVQWQISQLLMMELWNAFASFS